MPSTGSAFLFPPERTDRVRLRTLIMLRWMAVAGQLLAIIVADRIVGLQLPLGLCYFAVGTSVIANLVSTFVFPENKRLSETEALLTLLFDLSQLSFLLCLTGGLTNPFALLILAPVTISASALELRTTVVLGGIAVGLVTLTGLIKVPLRMMDGTVLSVPPLFEFGFWLSIVIGLVFLGVYSRRVSTEIRTMSDALLATQMALAREQKLTDLGGVVAAAAHELGTPLATIKLVSTEMIDDLSALPELQDDARLIRDQADRCRDILRSMGRSGKDDLHLRKAPLSAVLAEAAEPHLDRGKTVVFTELQDWEGEAKQPQIVRQPELIHGLRNLVQNAVDFARTTIWIDAEWSATRITVRIVDDGAGFPPQLIGRIGDPFLRFRRADAQMRKRPEYEGMGLGLFIAKTLLERTGAELTFANAADPFLNSEERPDRCGAVIEVIWPIAAILAPPEPVQGPNAPITD